MELAYWIDWQQEPTTATPPGRAYFGHETCQHLLPPRQTAVELARRLQDTGRPATLVTPLLSDEGIDRARRLIDSLLHVLGELEVVCSDWGLLDLLGRSRIGTPIVGRLLAAQSTDPRISRILASPASMRAPRQVRHLDGTLCKLEYEPPSPRLALHYRGCWLDKLSVMAFLMERGIRRAEISNLSQGIELTGEPGWSYSLHVPEVLITIMRNCPATGEDFNRAAICRTEDCNRTETTWYRESVPVRVFRRGNGLYYRWPHLPANLSSLPIDRIVHRGSR